MHQAVARIGTPIVCLGLALACARSEQRSREPRAPLASPVGHAGSSANQTPAPIGPNVPEPSFGPPDASNGATSTSAIATFDGAVPGPLDATSADAAGTVAPSGLLQLEVSTKASPDSPYQPLNLLAVWVENEARMPIKVIGRWGFARASLLRVFNAHVPNAFGSTLATDAGVAIAAGDPDVISGASLRSHELHSLSWDLTDYTGAPVPDGAYTIYIESTDSQTESFVTELDFIKGPDPVVIELEDSEHFGPISLVYTPAAP